MKKICTFLFIVFMSFQAHALNCKDPKNQMESNECSSAEFDKEDKLLNKVYSELRKNLEKKDQDKLKTAQTSWIKYKEQFCEFEGLLMEGGSMQPLVISDCKKELTISQRNRLSSLIK